MTYSRSNWVDLVTSVDLRWPFLSKIDPGVFLDADYEYNIHFSKFRECEEEGRRRRRRERNAIRRNVLRRNAYTKKCDTRNALQRHAYTKKCVYEEMRYEDLRTKKYDTKKCVTNICPRTALPHWIKYNVILAPPKWQRQHYLQLDR